MGESVHKDRGEILLRKILLDTNEPAKLRQKVIGTLVEINNPNSIRELILVITNAPNMRIRYYAVQAINSIIHKMDKNLIK